MNIFQIGAISVAGALLALQFKQQKEEYGILISIIIGLIVSFAILEKMVPILEGMKKIASLLTIHTEYVMILVKIIGISYVTELSCGVCKDAGYGVIATQIELFGKIMILTFSIPILMELLEIIRGFFV